MAPLNAMVVQKTKTFPVFQRQICDPRYLLQTYHLSISNTQQKVQGKHYQCTHTCMHGGQQCHATFVHGKGVRRHEREAHHHPNCSTGCPGFGFLPVPDVSLVIPHFITTHTKKKNRTLFFNATNLCTHPNL
jgi:hypothetical protein